MRDFTKIPNYSKRQIFLDKEGPVTIQRYDDNAYPKIYAYDAAQRGDFWVPEEISLIKDKNDFKEANEATRHIFTSNILRQTTLDSKQGIGPFQIFEPVTSIPEFQSLLSTWSFFEILHSRSYSHIIRNVYSMPTVEFNKIHENQDIMNMVTTIDKPYSDLHLLNSKKIINPSSVTEHEHIKAIWFALIASYGMEAIRFMVSFATSLGMKENKIFMGNGDEIELIMNDEMLHKDWTAYIINAVKRDDLRFAEVANETKKETHDMLVSYIDEEKAWSKYQFKFGSVIGLNENIMNSHVDQTAFESLAKIDIKYGSKPQYEALPWMKKYYNTSKKQNANQEKENIEYVSGGMTSSINYSELRDL